MPMYPGMMPGMMPGMVPGMAPGMAPGMVPGMLAPGAPGAHAGDRDSSSTVRGSRNLQNQKTSVVKPLYAYFPNWQSHHRNETRSCQTDHQIKVIPG